MHPQTDDQGTGYGREPLRQLGRDRGSAGTAGRCGRRGRRSGRSDELRPDAGAAGARTGGETPRRARRWPDRGRAPASSRSREEGGRCGCGSPTTGSRRPRRGSRRARATPPTPTSPPASATPSTSGARTRPRRSTSATSATSRSATRSAPRLRQAGARVEHRSLICDVGRSMGEAMAGVVTSGREQQLGADGDREVRPLRRRLLRRATSPPSRANGAEERRRRGLGRPRVGALRRQGRRADDAGAGRRPAGARTVVEDARLGDLRPAQDPGPARRPLRQGDLRVRLPARGRRADQPGPRAKAR